MVGHGADTSSRFGPPNFQHSGGLIKEHRTVSLESLARQAITGDPQAVADLLAELRPEIVRTTRLVVGAGSAAAEDAAQEALIDVMRGIASLREPNCVRGWALRVATSRALKVARRERLLTRLRQPETMPGAAVAPAEPRAEALKAAFDRLPPRMRAIAVLRLYAGLQEAETAELLGCSVGTVKSQLHDARGRLADALRENGVVPVTANGSSPASVG